MCACLLTLRAWVSICGEFHVVAREQTLPPIELSFPPITVVFVEHRDHLTLLKGQLVVILRHVVVHADHLAQSFGTRDEEDGRSVSVFSFKVTKRLGFLLSWYSSSFGFHSLIKKVSNLTAEYLRS